jgi:hypothetical protein
MDGKDTAAMAGQDYIFQIKSKIIEKRQLRLKRDAMPNFHPAPTLDRKVLGRSTYTMAPRFA